MGWFIFLVGIFWITFGISGLVATKGTNLALGNLIKNAKRQSLGLFSLIFGVLLLLSASSTKEPWFVLVLGILAFLKGAMIVLLSEQKLKAIIDWWLAAPEIIYKGWATLMIILGLVMMYIR